MINSLIPFFNPRGIAVIGASSHPQKLGYGVTRNLIQSGYAGAIHLVNPKGGDVFEREMLKSIAEIPEPVDLAILVIPAKYAPETMRACGERSIKATILVSGGFRETGEEGATLEAETLKIAQEYAIRMIGPNCIGLLDTHLPLDTTFLNPPMPRPGEIAFISHSGAICAALIDWSKEQGFSFSRLISLGNQADVSETDILPLVAEDEHTKVIALYLENISDGVRFIEETRKIIPQKPIIALKVGRSESGQRAAASHTGALAGVESAFDAAFEKAGVFRADTTEEIFDWARALAWSPLPQGRRVAILTNAGGPGVIAADALESHQLNLANLAPETLTTLAALLPAAASTRNPVDMLASATAADYAESLHALLADPNTDAVLVLLPAPPMYPAENAVQAMLPIVQNAEKPVLFSLMGSVQIEKAAQILQDAKIPDYRFPERAASALARLVERAEFLSMLKPPSSAAGTPPRAGEGEIDTSAPPPTSPDLANIRTALADVPNGNWLDPELADRLMSLYAIPTSPIKLASSAEKASKIATDLGYPLAMKIASPDIPHKSDVDGILLNLASTRAVVEGYEMLIKGVQAKNPRAKLEGVHLQKMIPAGQEVIVGAVRDPQFGALMMFGSGGVEVEGLKDVAFAIAPLSEKEASKMLEKTWAGKKLDGYRNLPAVDKTALVDALCKLSHLAHDLSEIAEIEINPLTVLDEGVVAVDVRVKMV